VKNKLKYKTIKNNNELSLKNKRNKILMNRMNFQIKLYHSKYNRFKIHLKLMKVELFARLRSLILVVLNKLFS